MIPKLKIIEFFSPRKADQVLNLNKLITPSHYGQN